MSKYAELKEAAEAATPEWKEDQWGAIVAPDGDTVYFRGVTIAGSGSRVPQAKLNTSFVCAANPAAILALLSEREQLREALKAAADCAECWYYDATGGEGCNLPAVLDARAVLKLGDSQ